MSACCIRSRGRWAWRLVMLCVGALVLVQAVRTADAQTFDATGLREPAGLDAPWRVHGGDDPAYARADFDDARWMLFDPHKDVKDLFKDGHPEVVWYRLRVKVDPKQTGLGVQAAGISRACEVYVNGERLMTSGRVSPFTAYTWNALVVRPIPDRMLAGGALTIAVRAHISRQEWSGPRPSLDDGNITIGQAATLTQNSQLAIVGSHSFTWMDDVLRIALGLVALVLFAAQRRQTEYLWIAALGLLTLLESIEPMVATFHNIPLYWEAIYGLMRVATPYIWVSMYFAFVGQRVGMRWKVVLIVAGLLNAFSGIQPLYWTLPIFVQFLSNILFIILLSVVVPVMLAIHWRRGNREAGILLIPAVLFSLYIYAEVGFEVLYQIPGRQEVALGGLNFIDRYQVGPFFISLDNLSSILSTLSLAIIMLLRSTWMSRRQAILDSELAAAQQVQQVLLPEEIEMVAGFDVDTVYAPAQQVGGDFFQILPAGKGGLLAVVGDVAGKGLPAAMMVSVLVGAIRGVAEYTSDPEELLASLNERLVGRGGGGFSTALVAHITADGWVTIANAGHLSPYLDGREMELHGALPLGVMSGTTYETSQFYLAHGSRLVFYSDGVVEAQNEAGELFGFDRAKEISTQEAAEIVGAAQAFGQEDDITVVTITRHGALATAA